MQLNENPAPLDSQPRWLLRAVQRYQVVQDEHRGPWKVRTTEYIYTLEDAEEHEAFAYHWHPSSRVSYPHLHIPTPDYAGKHLPTGRIALEDVIRLAIEEYGVKPHREDWARVLTDTLNAFEDQRTSLGSGPR